MENIQLNHTHHKPSGAKYPVCLLVHDFDVPMNIGSLFRIADAFGLEKIYLTGSSLVPPNNKIKKTSRSTEKHVAYSYENDPVHVIEKLKSEGYTIISLEITSTSIDITELKISQNEKICLVAGAESKGVSQELLDASDKTVHIPMLGINSSMNVATACAVATFEIIRRYEK